MKRHYEIMRIMRANVVDSRELWNSVESILYLHDAIRYRVDDLASMSVSSFLPFGMLMGSTYADTFSQQRFDPEKQFQSFAHGIASRFFFPCSVSSPDVLVIVQVFP
jgi:hypothetical protein